MARYRLSEPAKSDLSTVLRASEAMHGVNARTRYRALLSAALRRISSDPFGHSTVDRSELIPGVRSFHIRHGRTSSDEARVADPVHVIFYRVVEPGVIEILRLLHERMEPSRHVGN